MRFYYRLTYSMGFEMMMSQTCFSVVLAELYKFSCHMLLNKTYVMQYLVFCYNYFCLQILTFISFTKISIVQVNYKIKIPIKVFYHIKLTRDDQEQKCDFAHINIFLSRRISFLFCSNNMDNSKSSSLSCCFIIVFNRCFKFEISNHSMHKH